MQPEKRRTKVIIRMQPHLTGVANWDECCTAIDERTIRLRNPVKPGYVEASYTSVLPPNTSQATVHAQLRDVVEDALVGISSCVLAYGPTGTGKTYTMLGPVTMPAVGSKGIMEEYGLIPRIVHELFCKATNTTSVTCSYMEIYNDRIIDLLQLKEKDSFGRSYRATLSICGDETGGIAVKNLHQIPITSLAEVGDVIKIGSQQRSFRQTMLNQHSSRGHTILQLRLATRKAADDPHVVRAKVNLVDLAGSEPHPGGEVTAQSHAAETRAINVSLSALVSVVSALGSGRPAAHVPYRNSKLTTVLRDSLGGNCNTFIIATLSPLSSAYHETYSTLQFANRAAAIVNNVVRNECHDIKGILAAKEEEILSLRAKVEQLMQKVGTPKHATHDPSQAILQQRIDSLRQALAVERDRALSLEAKISSASDAVDLAASSGDCPETNAHNATGEKGVAGIVPALNPVPHSRLQSPAGSKRDAILRQSHRPSQNNKSQTQSSLKQKSRPVSAASKNSSFNEKINLRMYRCGTVGPATPSKLFKPVKGQTFRELGQQLIRSQQQRQARFRSKEDLSHSCSPCADQASGGDSDGINELFEKYAILAKDLASAKIFYPAALPRPHPLGWMSPHNSLHADYGNRSSAALGNAGFHHGVQNILSGSMESKQRSLHPQMSARSSHRKPRSFGLSGILQGHLSEEARRFSSTSSQVQ